MKNIKKSFPAIQNKKIRAAIVGCGRIFNKHFQSINEHKNDIELVSICEIKEELLRDCQKKYSVLKGYISLVDMLKSESLDLVILCTPSGIHAEQAELCAKYQVNVMTEKPMATSYNDGLRMVKACEDANVRLFVVKQNRKNPTLQLLKRAIDENRFDKIYMVHLNVFWHRSQEYYNQAPWRGTFKYDGGAFMNQASHYVDLLDWLIGPLDNLQSMMSTTRDIEVEDTGVLNLKWKKGTLGSMSVTMLTHAKNLEASITVIGEKGTVRIGGVAMNDIQHWEFLNKKDYDNKVKEVSYETGSVYGFGHPLYYRNVIDVLYGKAEPETDGREGLKSLEILVATYLSAKENRIISLPLRLNEISKS